MYSYGPPHMAMQKQDDQLELTYSNYVRTQDVTLKTCRRRWVIGRSSERGSGISVLAARHDDDDDDDEFISWFSVSIEISYSIEGSPLGVVAIVLDRDIIVSKFEFQLHYYVHFQTNTPWKSINPLIPPR